MKQGKAKIIRHRQTELEGLIAKTMRDVAALAANSNHSDHLGSAFICAAYDMAEPTGQQKSMRLQGAFKSALKRRYSGLMPKKVGLQCLLSYYLRKLCSLDESTLRYELNAA